MQEAIVHRYVSRIDSCLLILIGSFSIDGSAYGQASKGAEPALRC